jgi:adenylate cyclase
MGIEIERKFLVKGNKWKDEVILKTVEIEQGFLVKSPELTVRIRLAGDQGFLTIKGKRVDISCPEHEYEIPAADARELVQLSVTPLVRKTRHYVRDVKNQLWEVDVFKGINRGLVMAEKELTHAKQVVTLPSWIGTEVSHDVRYINTYLAENKVPRSL